MSNDNIKPLNISLQDYLQPTSFPEPKPSEYYNVQQGEMQSLVYKGINRPVKTDLKNFTGEGIVEEEGKKLIFEDYDDLIGKIGPTASHLYLALSIELAKSNTNSIRLPLDQYMQMRGLRDKKTARDQARKDLETLVSIRVEFREKRRGKQGDYLNIRLSGGTQGIVNGVIVFNFNTDYFNYVKQNKALPIPKGILLLNQNKNPHSQFFLITITNLKVMNRYKDNEDIISVKTLLKATQLPKYEDIKKSGRIAQRIIEPFERDMDALKNTVLWDYCGPKGAQVDGPTNYEEFITSLVKITWVEPFPEPKNSSKSTPKNRKKRGGVVVI